jgi:hypothetical protein
MFEDDSNRGKATFYDFEHGMCELWTPRESQDQTTNDSDNETVEADQSHNSHIELPDDERSVASKAQ